MRERLSIGACMLLLTAGVAYAADAEKACFDQLAAAETLADQSVEAKALSEGEVEEVNLLLDQADALCTEGKYDEASKRLTSVNEMVSRGAAPAQ